MCHPELLSSAFIHPVSKDDTLQRIVLAYNISPHHFCAANRLWLSDSIHTRNSLIIPIAHCNIDFLCTSPSTAVIPAIGQVDIRPLPPPCSSLRSLHRCSTDSDTTVSSVGSFVQDKLWSVYRRLRREPQQWTCTDLIEL